AAKSRSNAMRAAFRLSFGSLVALAAAACSEPAFEFRGYNDRSTCPEVIDTEIAAGFEFVGAYEPDPEVSTGVVTELAGEIATLPLKIEVDCGRSGQTNSVSYVFVSPDVALADAVFDVFSADLMARFGEPAERVFGGTHTQLYLCGDPATVVLEQSVIELDDVDDADADAGAADAANAGQAGEPPAVEHEVSLVVVPRRTEC
ncbi:MAG: hypothetical protein R3305_11630, partial [Gammaproteobacteria bacterium]|nr:hypothetical protein [Gammaproteobacteria bacterium]